MSPLLLSSSLYGIVSLAGGVFLCLTVGISFVIKALITFIACMAIEYGLMLLGLPTLTQLIKRFIGMFHN